MRKKIRDMIIFQGNNLVVELPSPEFGNEIKLPLRVVAKRAMSGERYSYITRPVKAIHSMSFAHLNSNQIEQMYAFIRANVGKYIQYNELNVEESTISPDRKNYFHTARILDGAVEFQHRAIRDNIFSLNLEVGDYT
jgi:hypothetical protein